MNSDINELRRDDLAVILSLRANGDVGVILYNKEKIPEVQNAW
jgi:hypothetical protein